MRQATNCKLLQIAQLSIPLFFISLTAGTLSAESNSRVTKLTMSAAAEPQPALKYHLLPEFLEQTAENAAPQYKKIISSCPDYASQERISDWLDMPLDELPRDEIRAVLEEERVVFEQLKQAARCQNCIWEIPIKDLLSFKISFLETFDSFTHLMGLIKIKARLEVAEGDYEKAVETMQIGYAMARHIAQRPLVCDSMYAIAVVSSMTEVMEELIAQPSSPNMYWALTNLPTPIVSFHRAIANEKHFFYILIPELRNIDELPDTAEYWNSIVDRVDDSFFTALYQGYRYSKKQNTRCIWTCLIALDYPRCKSDLIANGFSAKRLEAMPVAKVVVIHSLREFNKNSDDIVKWARLPYWQAKNGLEAIDKRLTKPESRLGFSQLFLWFQQCLSNCKRTEARVDRSIALLRTIEAVRLYAASHNGKLPDQLADIKDVPLPLDPFTGEVFAYQLKDNMAVIEVSESLEGMLDNRTIELRIDK